MLRAFATGFLGACAMGPIFLLILNRAIERGFLHGFFSAIGVSLADGTMFVLGNLGFLSLATHSAAALKILEFIGGALLLKIGISSLITLFTDFSLKVTEPLELDKASAQGFKHNPLWLAFSTFALNMINPVTILFFTTVAGRFFPELAHTKIHPVWLLYIGGMCFAGSLLVLTIVSMFASLIAKLLIKRVRILLQFCATLVFLAIGAYLLFGCLKFVLQTCL
jgi:putative LysE/RhtB family amino acid efflux pump